MKKLIFSMFSLFLFVLILPMVGHAEESPIHLFLDSKPLVTEVSPRIVNGITLVPVRIISEQLAAKVSWNEKERKVTIEKSGMKIELYPDNKQAIVNEKMEPLEVAPAIVAGNTLLPLRFIADKLALKTNWDNLTRSVNLYKNDTGIVGKDAVSDKIENVNKGIDADGAKSTNTQPTSVPNAPQIDSNKLPLIESTVPQLDVNKAVSDAKVPIPVIQPDASIKKAMTEIQSIQTVNDQLLIQANGELKPYVFNLADQNRLVLDLPYNTLSKQIIGTGSAQNGEIPTAHPLIAKISYSLFSSETSTIRIVIDLRKKIEYNLIENKPAKQVGLSIKILRYKVVIDAGHGDHDSGAVSITGKYEKVFTLAMVTKINKLLEKEPLIQTVLTRDDDSFVTLDDRVADANKINANVFVSIHGNKFKPDIRGVETYYYNDFSLPLATIMHRNILKATGFPDRNVRKENFRVIKYTNMPAILCEIGYLSNKDEEAEMYKDEAQGRYAASIVAGIKEFLQIK